MIAPLIARTFPKDVDSADPIMVALIGLQRNLGPRQQPQVLSDSFSWPSGNQSPSRTNIPFVQRVGVTLLPHIHINTFKAQLTASPMPVSCTVGRRRINNGLRRLAFTASFESDADL